MLLLIAFLVMAQELFYESIFGVPEQGAETERGHMDEERPMPSLTREASTSDRRVKRVVITDAGNRLYAEMKNEAAAVRQQLLASIEVESLAHLTERLEQLHIGTVDR
jgi:hypothetical protein